MPLVDSVYIGIPLGDSVNIAVYTGTPLEKLSWNCPTLECYWRNSDYCSLHWNTLEGLWQPKHTHAHIVKQSSIHASLKWHDDGTTSSKWTGLWYSSFYLEFTALRCIRVLLFKHVNTSTSLCARPGYEHYYTFCVFGFQIKWDQLSSNKSLFLTRHSRCTVYIRACKLESDLT